MYQAKTRSSEQPILKAPEVVEVARSYLNVRFQHQGRSKQGIDCIGFLACIAKDLGLEYDDHVQYARAPKDSEFLYYLNKYLVKIDKKDLRPADIVFLRDKRWIHCGLIAERNNYLTIIHAYAKFPRKVCEHRLDLAWQNRIKACFRFKDLA